MKYCRVDSPSSKCSYCINVSIQNYVINNGFKKTSLFINFTISYLSNMKLFMILGSMMEGQIKLIDGPTLNEGRLMINYKQHLGAV